MDKEKDNGDICDVSVNSIACLNVSRRCLVRLRDRIEKLDSSLKDLESSQRDVQEAVSEAVKDVVRLKSLFESLFERDISAIKDEGSVRSELSREEALLDKIESDQITLGISEMTRVQIMSVMDAIRIVSEEVHGPAPKEIVMGRAKKIGIDREKFDEILRWLRKAEALVESGGLLRLV
jgi:chromosome segregation ATPase